MNFLPRLEGAEAQLRAIIARTHDLESELKSIRADLPAEEIVKPVIEEAPQPPPVPQKVKVRLEPKVESKEVKVKAAPELPVKDLGGMELQMGRVWFVRIGIMLLLTGFVFLGNYAYEHYVVRFSAGLRLTLLYVLTFSLSALGILFEKSRENLRQYGRTLAAGGLAGVYYCSFAAYHVEALRVIESPVSSALLMGIAALLLVGYAQWRQSPKIMTAALGMAFYATAINPVGWLAALSALVLSVFAVAVMVKNQWKHSCWVPMVGAYLSFLWWQFLVAQPGESTLWFLPAYWLLYSIAGLQFRIREHSSHDVVFLSVNNALCFGLLSLGLSELGQLNELWKLALAAAVAIGGLAYFSKPLGRVHFLTQSVAFLSLAIVLKLSGYWEFLILMFNAVALAGAAKKFQAPYLRWISYAVAGLSFILMAHHWPSAAGLPLASWGCASLLWLVYGMVLRGQRAETGKFGGLDGWITASVTCLILYFGACQSLVVADRSLVFVPLGAAAALMSRAEWFRKWGIELLIILQGLGLFFGITDLTKGDSSWLLLLSSTLCYLCTWWKRGMLSEEEIQSLPIQRWAFSILTVLCFLLLVLGVSDSANIQVVIFSLLPGILYFVGRRIGEVTLRWVPLLLYLGVFYRLFDADQAAFFLGSVLLVIHGWLARKELVILNFVTFVFSVVWFAFLITGGQEVSVWLSLSATVGLWLARERKLKICYLFSVFYFLVAIGMGDFEILALSSRYLTVLIPLSLCVWKGRGEEGRFYAQFSAVFTAVLWGVLSFDAAIGNLALAWALLGMSIFILGLTAQMRSLRISAMVILALSIGHVGLVDVWRLDPLPRIVSLLTLGSVLLGLGFVYNRWQDRLKDWL